MRKIFFSRRMLVIAALLTILGSPAFGRMASAQEGTVQPIPQTQVVETDNDNDFPWGLLGLLGLGGLAGLRRHEEPQRIQAVDASRVR